MQPTMDQYRDVERQVQLLCAASGVSQADCLNARVHTTKTYIQVHLTHNGDNRGRFGWVLRYRHWKKGKALLKPTLFQVLLDEDDGALIPAKLVNGNELPWGYT